VPHRFLSPIEDIIEDARQGKMFILVDDEDRENEGDLIIPAEKADAGAINFMAKYGRGLICLAMTGDRVAELDLPLMSQSNRTRHQTAFTVSIEAAQGVSTGISAADRALTVAAAIDPTKGKDDIVTPGHVFPLVARDGGVLVRAGHTEAAVDIARMAGLNPAGVICEIMKDDGSMARLPDLVEFAKEHDLKVATIADLIAYRRQNDHLIELIAETKVDTVLGGEFNVRAYLSKDDGTEHLALIKGDMHTDEPVLVRVHVYNLFEDFLGEASPRFGQFQKALSMLKDEERGVIIVLREKENFLENSIRARQKAQERKLPKETILRNYGIGAQILSDLGLKNIMLMSNTAQHVVGIEGYDLNIVGSVPISKEHEIIISDKED